MELSIFNQLPQQGDQTFQTFQQRQLVMLE